MDEAMPASPFLPGTKIQYAWDSTSLGYLKTCPRLYQYHMLEGWVPKDESIHLRFGSEYHSAIQDYENLRAEGQSFDDAVRETVHRLLIRIDKWEVDHTCRPGNYKNPKSLLFMVVSYLDEYHPDPCTTVILENGKPAVELSFRFELDWGPQASGVKMLNDVLGQPYLLCGHLDRVVTFQDEIFILDHKTTTTTPTDYYFAGYSPNNQMTLYAFAGQVVLGTTITGVIVEAAQITLQEPNKFVRRPTYRPADTFDEWLNDLEYWLNAAEAFAEADHWPMNDTACGNYGGCKFRNVCSKSPQVRDRFLAADFIKLPESERWNPLRNR
jgi:hypothetical protein